MSTNVFNSGAMAAAAALGPSGNSHHHHHSALNTQSAMLFAPTPVAGTPLGLSSSPTAFPFPPPSPLFLSSLNLLQSPQPVGHVPLHQQLSPWISSGPMSTLSSLALSNSSPIRKSSELKEFISDNNNNDLSIGNAQAANHLASSPHKSKYSSEDNVAETDIQPCATKSAFSLNQPKESKQSYSNGLIDSKHEKHEHKSDSQKSFSPTKPQAGHCRPDIAIVPETTVGDQQTFQRNRSSSPSVKSMSKLPDSKVSTDCITNGSTMSYKCPSFPMLAPYISSSPSVSSPTFPLPIPRPPPPSPQTPTPNQSHSFGSHYSHYLLPPSLYPYYHNQHPPQTYSPTSQSQSSPMSTFLVPNLPQLASSLVSALPNNTYNHSPQQERYSTQPSQPIEQELGSGSVKPESMRDNSRCIDLTSDRSLANSPDDKRKSESKSPHEATNTSLKRKTPIDEAFKTNDSLTSSTPGESEGESNFSSRKHRIFKPPNINLSGECDYRNGYASAFLPSPLFAQTFASHPPYHPFLDHIPLSAPPITSSHMNSSNCCDFSSQPNSFSFPSPRLPPSNRDLSQMSQYGSSASQSITTGPTSNLSINSNNNGKATDTMPNSIMRDSKKSKSIINGSDVNSNHSETKVTFQVPQSVSKNTPAESTEKVNNGGKSHKKSMYSVNNNNRSNKQQSQQPYAQYFRKGSTIKLGNGELKKVEELSTEDFIESATLNGKFKVELSEVMSLGEKTKKGIVRITFLVGQSRVKVTLESPVEHPFFVYHKGWSSCSPSASSKQYGLSCHRLCKGDTVVTLASSRPTANHPNQLHQSNRSLSHKMPYSLASSSGSLSSSSSSSSSSSTSSLVNLSNSNNVPISLGKYPPPAHVSEPSHKSLLQANHEAPLNYNPKYTNNNKCLIKLSTNNRIFRDGGGGSGVSRKDSLNHRSQEAEEDEEIDVEGVDEEDNANTKYKSHFH